MSMDVKYRRVALLECLNSFGRPVSFEELNGHLRSTRQTAADGQDSLYGTLASQNNALSVTLRLDLAVLHANGHVREFEGTYEGTLRPALIG